LARWAELFFPDTKRELLGATPSSRWVNQIIRLPASAGQGKARKAGLGTPPEGAAAALDGAGGAGPRDREAAAVVAERRWLRDGLARAVDHRDRRRAERAECQRLSIPHRAAAGEPNGAEVIERDDPATGARRLLDPLGRRTR